MVVFVIKCVLSFDLTFVEATVIRGSNKEGAHEGGALQALYSAFGVEKRLRLLKVVSGCTGVPHSSKTTVNM